MRALGERVTLDACNLGSVANLQGLTAALEEINHDLEQPHQCWSRTELLEFRRTLGGLGEVVIKLRIAARARLSALTGADFDAL
jgi:hypothetical protein